MTKYDKRSESDASRIFVEVDDFVLEPEQKSESVIRVNRRRAMPPQVTINHVIGTFHLNQAAVAMLGVKRGDKVGIVQDQNDPRNMALVIHPSEGGLPLCEFKKANNSTGVYDMRFNSKALSRQVLSALNQTEGVTIPLATHVEDGRCELITRRAFVARRSKHNRSKAFSNFPFNLVHPYDLLQFCEKNRVEVVMEADYSYMCYINDSTGGWSVGSNAVETLYIGVRNYIDSGGDAEKMREILKQREDERNRRTTE